jgi:hypothetical protein
MRNGSQRRPRRRNGEVFLTFEQEVIHELVHIEQRRVELEDHRASVELAQLELQTTDAQNAAARVDRFFNLISVALPMLAEAIGVRPKIEFGICDPAGFSGVAGVPRPADAAANESNAEESEAEGIPTPADAPANEISSEEPRAAHG